MEKNLLKVEKRNETERGKGNARSMRREGILPGILYSKGESVAIKLPKKEMSRLMSSGGGERSLITIEISGEKGKKKGRPALIKDYQLDPIKNELLHIDFMEISLDEKIKLTVPVVITAQPIGVKNGGILQQPLRDIEVECLPTQIPEGIEIDASAVDIGNSLHVSDLTVKEGVQILSDPQAVIINVSAPVIEEEPVVAPLEEEAAEPEVAKKGKEAAGEEEAKPEEQKEQKDTKEQKDSKEQKDTKEQKEK